MLRRFLLSACSIIKSYNWNWSLNFFRYCTYQTVSSNTIYYLPIGFWSYKINDISLPAMNHRINKNKKTWWLFFDATILILAANEFKKGLLKHCRLAVWMNRQQGKLHGDSYKTKKTTVKLRTGTNMLTGAEVCRRIVQFHKNIMLQIISKLYQPRFLRVVVARQWPSGNQSYRKFAKSKEKEFRQTFVPQQSVQSNYPKKTFRDVPKSKNFFWNAINIKT